MSECRRYGRVTTTDYAIRCLDAVLAAMRDEVKHGTSLQDVLERSIEHARDKGLCENTGALLIACERLLRAEQEIVVKA